MKSAIFMAGYMAKSAVAFSPVNPLLKSEAGVSGVAATTPAAVKQPLKNTSQPVPAMDTESPAGKTNKMVNQAAVANNLALPPEVKA